MEYNGVNLCDFCFKPLGSEYVCANCGLTHKTYQTEPGLLMPGTNLLGKYIIGRVLGRGGFGATYLAYSSDRSEAVAIKEYYPVGIANRAKGEEKISIVSDEKQETFNNGVKRLYEEANIIARFNANKNVVSVYEIFYANNTVYYSMEYLHGTDLKGYVKQKGGKLTEAESVTIMKGICDALVTVHSTQTLHRDISPDNVFICTNGDVKLIDFGAAKQIIGAEQQKYSVVLKQGFAPVEQYKTDGKQGVWTDIYAIGATIYYALTGIVPIDAMSRFDQEEILFDHIIHVSDNFKNIIKKCMKLKPEERYQSAGVLLAELNKLKSEGMQVDRGQPVHAVSRNTETDANGDNRFDTPNTQDTVYEKNNTSGTKVHTKKNRASYRSILAVVLILAFVVAGVFSAGMFHQQKTNVSKKFELDNKSNIQARYVEKPGFKVSFNGTDMPLRYPLIDNADTYMISEDDLVDMFNITTEKENNTLIIRYNREVFYIDIQRQTVRDGNANIIDSFDVAPIKNDENVLMLPLVEIAELLGASVEFDESGNRFEIVMKNATAEPTTPDNVLIMPQECPECGSTAHTEHPKSKPQKNKKTVPGFKVEYY